MQWSRLRILDERLDAVHLRAGRRYLWPLRVLVRVGDSVDIADTSVFIGSPPFVHLPEWRPHFTPLYRARLRVTFSPPILPSTCPAAQVVVERRLINGVVLAFGTNLNGVLNLEVVSTIASEFSDDVAFSIFRLAHHARLSRSESSGVRRRCDTRYRWVTARRGALREVQGRR